jgi:hypothetical protein
MMTDQPGETGEFSAATSAAVDLWLRRSGALARPQEEAPAIPLLVRYLGGVLTAVEAGGVERGLLADPQSRRRLTETSDLLDDLSERPWTEVEAWARGEGVEGEVAREWLALLTLQTSRMARTPAAWLAVGWDGIRQGVAEGAQEAQAAWTALLAFTEQFRMGLRMPRLATVKGGAGEETVAVLGGELPSAAALKLDEARVGVDGTLRVRLLVVDRSGQPTEVASGRTLTLALAANGEAYPLLAAVVEGDEVSWTLPELGSSLQLPPGSLPPASLAILVAPTSMALPSGEGTLLAQVVDREGREGAAPPVALRIHSAARWGDGQFTVRLSIPRAIRLAYQRHTLILDLPITVSQAQRLGEWPLHDWEDEPRLLAVSCPGSHETTLPTVSLLRARLRPSPDN